MRSTARAVVIGGGVGGVSTLYHLARKGWSDVVLVERKELTSGSTWHAAGLLPLFNLSYSVGQIHKYSVALYKTLEAETGQSVGFKQVSNIRIARTPDRWDEYMYYKGVADTIGVGTPEKTKRVMDAVLHDVPIDEISGHFHDTYGMATANVYACLELGISTFDTSIAGLGGCPYAKGATGNVATEDVLYLLAGLGIDTGIDFAQAVATGQWISGVLNRKAYSRAGNAVTAKLAA